MNVGSVPRVQEEAVFREKHMFQECSFVRHVCVGGYTINTGQTCSKQCAQIFVYLNNLEEDDGAPCRGGVGGWGGGGGGFGFPQQLEALKSQPRWAPGWSGEALG